MLLDKAVVEPVSSRIFSAGGEVHLSRARPIKGSQAHGAGFASGVHFTIRQLKVIQSATGIPDGHDFRMGCRVVGGGD